MDFNLGKAKKVIYLLFFTVLIDHTKNLSFLPSRFASFCFAK
jgi:hypothetical protein